MWVAAEADLVDVVGGQVGGGVGFASEAGAPVAALSAVGVDGGLAALTVRGTVDLRRRRGVAVSVVFALMLGAPCLVL